MQTSPGHKPATELKNAACHSAIPKKTSLLGVDVSVVDMNSAVDTISRWVVDRETRYVCAADMHSIMQAQDSPSHGAALRNADMVLPDGAPLVWVLRILGERSIRRVCGPDLMLKVLERSAHTGCRHFFYGSSEDVVQRLARKMCDLYPGTTIVGMEAPPFHALSDVEVKEAIGRINQASPNIVWIGLGCPKQEQWMFDNASKLSPAVVVGVGAAFDFHSGRRRRAPRWMRRSGLEWLYRLLREPQRLSHRYLYMGPRFIGRSVAEISMRAIGLNRR